MCQAMAEYVAGVLEGLIFVLIYELIKTVIIAVLPLGGITAVLFFIVECILMFNYIDSIIQLWDKYQETGEEIYAQEAVIQVASFISLMYVLFKIKPNLEKIKASLKDTVAKLKKVPEYNKGVGACFIAGTLVLSAAGFVPIETVAAGSLVQSFDPQTQQVSLKEVEETFVRETMEFVHVTVGSEKITTTPEHPFYVAQKGFVKAVKLRAGDILCTVNGEYVIVEQVQHEILESPERVYNFRVADNHTYYVGRVGVGVHNSMDCTQPADFPENSKNYLEKALKQQGLSEIPNNFKQSWIEGGYKYEVRIHEGAKQYTNADRIYRVSRQKIPSSDPKVQGSGTEYLGTDGNWYHTRVLKPNNPGYNADAAKITHIPLEN